MGELLFHWVLHGRALGDRLVRARSPDPAFTTTQPTAVSSAEGGVVVPAPSTIGAGPSDGACACLRREFSGEPDAGNPHLRFDEGRGRRSPLAVTLSPTLPARMVSLTIRDFVSEPRPSGSGLTRGNRVSRQKLTSGRVP